MSGIAWALGGTLWFLMTTTCAAWWQRVAAWPMPVVILVVFLSSRWSAPAVVILAMWLGYLMGLQDGMPVGHEVLAAVLMALTMFVVTGRMIPQGAFSFAALCLFATVVHELMLWMLRLPQSTVSFADLMPILGWRAGVTGCTGLVLYPVFIRISPSSGFDMSLPRARVMGVR